MTGFDTITLLTDYGTADEFVGVLKSVIWSIAPQVRIVDLCHDIAPFDVRGAGLMLACSAQYLCPGVVVAVVDPGVPSTRRARSRSRWARACRRWWVPTTACSPRRWPWSAAPRAPSS
ncbi:MAG: SAM-dependent chlorinase/fluorinase [Acidimicrobiales bacterium]